MTDGFFRRNSADQEKKLDADLVHVDGLDVFRLRTVAPPSKVIVDDVSATVTYVGEAVVGAAEADPVWRIKKLLTSGTVLSILYPNGSANYEFIWANRASLSYI